MNIVKAEDINIPTPELGPFEKWVPEVSKSVMLMKFVKTVTVEKLDNASALLTSAKKIIKEIDAELDFVMRPYIELKKSVNDKQNIAKERAAEVQKPLEEAIKTLNDAILAYTKKAREDAAKAEKERLLNERSQQLATSGNKIEPEHNFAIPELLKVKGLSVVTKFEVTSPIQVPRGYCTPDMKLLEGAIKAGVRDIPGVRIYTEEKIIG